MCFMAFKDQDKINYNFDDDEYMIEYKKLLKDINKLDERILHSRKRFLGFKRNLMKSKKFFSKVEASKISLEKANKKLLKKNE